MNHDEAKLIVSKLKVGDKIKIKENLGSESYLISHNSLMLSYKGKEARITSTMNTDVHVDIDNSKWFWTPDMFEVLSKDKKIDEQKGECAMKNVSFNGKAIKRVIFSGDATIVLFDDGSKTVTKRLPSDTDDKEKALAMALVKTVYGTNYHHDIFGSFLPEPTVPADTDRPLQNGDKVRIREWDDMVKEYGTDRDGDIPLGHGGCFYKSEKKYCGSIMTIDKIDYFDDELYFEESKDITAYPEAVVRI